MATDSLDRRAFLRRSGRAAAAAGLILSGFDHRSYAKNETLGAACIGFNGRGQEHIKKCLTMKNVALVALCDVDHKVLDHAVESVGKKTGHDPKPYTDLRKVLEDKDVDVVFTATPNHWHALVTIWGVQAGKDVYVEKPACWSVAEGEAMMAAQAKYNRVVQVGHNVERAAKSAREAVGRVWAGQIGDVYLSRGLCYKERRSIGIIPDSQAPATLDWNLWQGPAKRRPFSARYVHYNWHWFWDFGCGDIGNQGVHQMDMARWLLHKELPASITSAGGRFGYKDDGQTPNTQFSTFHYPDGVELEFEVRGLPTNAEAGVKIGTLVYGAKGWLSEGDKWQARDENGPLPVPAGPLPAVGGAGGDHFQNFIDVVRSRKMSDLTCPVREGVRSAQLCALANIAYRCGRTLTFDPATMTFPGDEAANALLRRHDSPAEFAVPEADKV